MSCFLSADRGSCESLYSVLLWFFVLFVVITAGSALAQDCNSNSTSLCLNQNRFRVEVDWRDFGGNAGLGQVVPFGSDDSGLFYFFSSGNLEMLVKVLDGCSINNHFWVFSAATTDVQYTLRVTDTQAGVSRQYFNPLGTAADAITDTGAFATCSGADVSEENVEAELLTRLNPPRKNSSYVVSDLEDSYAGLKQDCVPSSVNLCLNDGRFRVEVDWRDFSGNTGSGQVVPFGSGDSGLFYFFSSENWEMLVKVLDGCSINDYFWVFSAATTDVEYTLKVTDTETGVVRDYTNPLGVAAAAITDTSAFATCTVDDSLPPDPGPAGDVTLEGIDSDGDGIRDDVQRYIALTYPGSPETRAALTMAAKATQDSLIEANDPSASLNHMTEAIRALECLWSIRPDDAVDFSKFLLAEIVNTEQRGLAYFDFDDQVSGGIFPTRKPEDWAQSCSSNASLDEITKQRVVLKNGCASNDTVIYYGNGVGNTPTDMANSLMVLAQRLESSLPEEEFDGLSFELAKNPSGGILEDLWEAYQQEVNTNFSQFLRMLLGIAVVPDSLREIFVDVLANVDGSALVNHPALQNQVSRYKTNILEGNKVVLVAHSQGNFFANQAYVNLTAEEQLSFGVVSVANPDDFVAGGGPYTTLTQDLVIRAVDILVGALPPNTSNGISIYQYDWTAHNFIEAYMRPGTSSFARIIPNVRDVRSNLAQPGADAGEGIITVTLTWGPEPDVDLHAFEPNGTHVYYANPTGPSGFLDVDDVTSFGPEHYFVSCDTLEAGTYGIGVNYFFGYGPETATVQVEAGLQVRSFQIFLPEARGTSGNDSPVAVANIIVAGDENAGYTFEIE